VKASDCNQDKQNSRKPLRKQDLKRSKSKNRDFEVLSSGVEVEKQKRRRSLRGSTVRIALRKRDVFGKEIGDSLRRTRWKVEVDLLSGR
jgi:hypothetical protein